MERMGRIGSVKNGDVKSEISKTRGYLGKTGGCGACVTHVIAYFVTFKGNLNGGQTLKIFET